MEKLKNAGWEYLAVCVVALVTCVAGLPNQFVVDDVSLIEQNDRAHTLETLFPAFGQPYWPPPFAPQLYRPIASGLIALQYVIGAGSPLIFRIVSYALYAGVGVAVLSVSRRMLPRPAAFAAALLFAAHPVHVEATALGVNQGELIVGGIAVLMTTLYIDGRSRGALTSRAWIALALLYAVACLTKENGFILPGLLIAAELTVVPGPTPWRRLWIGFAGLALVATVVGALRFAVLGGFAGAVPADVLTGVGGVGRTLTMLSVVPTWLRLLAWPRHLQADYSPNEIVAASSFGPRELAGLCILVLAAAVAWFARKRAPTITFGILWIAIALFPVSNLIVPTGILVAERTLFLPSVGIALVFGGVCWELWQRFSQARLGRESLGLALSVLIVFAIVRSASRQTVWRNAHRLALVTALDAPKSLRVQQAHREAVQDLIADYERRIAVAPQPWRVRNELAGLLEYMREDSLAIVHLRLSLLENPSQPEVAAELSRMDSERKTRLP
jgi:hypothetical protein